MVNKTDGGVRLRTKSQVNNNQNFDSVEIFLKNLNAQGVSSHRFGSPNAITLQKGNTAISNSAGAVWGAGTVPTVIIYFVI